MRLHKYFRNQKWQEHKKQQFIGIRYSTNHSYISKTVEPDDFEHRFGWNRRHVFEWAGHRDLSIAYDVPIQKNEFKVIRTSWKREMYQRRFWKKYAHRIVRHKKLTAYYGRMGYKHECGIDWLID